VRENVTLAWRTDFWENLPAFRLVPRALRENIRALESWPRVEEYNALFAATPNLPRFAVQDKARLKEMGGYDAFIVRQREVPTRPNNYHDFFNAMAWACFPKTKSLIHELQWREQRREDGRPGQNGRTIFQNALTAFDESGLLVLSSDKELLEQLLDLQWRECFWQRREKVLRSMRWFSLGHSTLEGLLTPHRGLTAKALLIETSGSCFESPQLLRILDLFLVEHLVSLVETTRSLAPIPVLGIPNWAHEQTEEFYLDSSYFRTKHIREVVRPRIHQLG